MDLEVLSIERRIAELESKINVLNDKPIGRSAQINEIATALAKAQRTMKVAMKEMKNTFLGSKYADLAEVVEASRPSLAENGLAVTQQIVVRDDGSNVMHTILMHSSGQWIESTVRVIPGKNDPQSFGSLITYLRRYMYSALVGVTVALEDDDAEVAMKSVRMANDKGTGLNAKYDARRESADAISKDQFEELEYELAEYPDITEQVLEGLKIQSLADMPKSKYRASIERIRSIKNTRNGA